MLIFLQHFFVRITSTTDCIECISLTLKQHSSFDHTVSCITVVHHLFFTMSISLLNNRYYSTEEVFGWYQLSNTTWDAKETNRISQCYWLCTQHQPYWESATVCFSNQHWCLHESCLFLTKWPSKSSPKIGAR